MEQYGKAQILILDDDQNLCQSLEDVISSWGMNSVWVCHPSQIMEKLNSGSFHVALLDVCLPQINGLDLIPEIQKRCPDCKIIIMTGLADKQTAIQAMRLGAFDFLEKPFQEELLFHVVGRALDAQSKEMSLRTLVEDLQRSHMEIVLQKNRLEHLNRQLLETNRALSIFAQNIEREREEAQKNMALKIKSLVIPMINKLRRDSNLSKYQAELDILASQIMDDFTSGFAADAKIAAILSFTELRIASLIKNGLSTEEIAEQLHISVSTVRTHRKNIRKKLKLNNGPYSLRNYLMARPAVGSETSDGLLP